VKVASQFAADPFQASGLLVCVNAEPVRVYQFATPDLAAAAAKSINPKDPSQVGTSIVEWVGKPRFWYRDRTIVLYAGDAPATEALLTSVLGAPFARGQGRAPMLPDTCP